MSIVQILRSLTKTLLAIFLPNNDFKGWKLRGNTSADNYFHEIDHESNDYLWKHISLSGAKSILEIGSNAGTRIFRKAQENPDIRFLGVDLNYEAVQKGNFEARSQSIFNLKFVQFDVRDGSFELFLFENHFDLIISWACLMYVHPFHMNRVLRNLIAGSKELLILEMNTTSRTSRLVAGGTNWKHNYFKLFYKLQSKLEVKLEIHEEEIPNHVWMPGGGGARLFKIKKVSS